jgi:hypothetical protein
VASQNGGRFFVRDAITGMAIDTVAVPASGSGAAWRTVRSPNISLRAGRAVWSVVADTGVFSVDEFTVAEAEVFNLTVVNGTGGGSYEAGTAVSIAAPDTSGGLRFLRWSGDAGITPEDVYSRTTRVVTVDADAVVTAHYAGVNALPGVVGADDFGYAWGIGARPGAAGGMAVRIDSANGFAEYLVNVEAGGYYRLSYGLLIGSGGGSFAIRDVTNNVALDTVAVPDSGEAAAATVTGRVANLKRGVAVWRIESLSGGGYGIDRFAAGEAFTKLTVINGAGSGSYAVGSVADIAAGAPEASPEAGYVFERWDGDSASLAAVSDVASETASVKIGESPITLTAVFVSGPGTSASRAGRVPLKFDIRATSAGNISFQVAKTEAVSIRAYDVRGRAVAVLCSGIRNPGFYNIKINAGRSAGLGNGLYIVRMESGSFSKNVKLHYSK